MRKVLIAFVLLFMAQNAAAQVGIGTDAPSAAAQLDIVASDRGILIPRVSLNSPTDASTITGGNEESLLVFNRNATAEMQPGYYYWLNNRWHRLLSDSEAAGSGPGNALTGEDLKAGDSSVVVQNGEGAVLRSAGIRVATAGITTEKLALGSVSPEKLSAAAEDAGKVATVQEDGSVRYEAIKAALPKFFYMPSIQVPVRERQVEGRFDAQDRLGRINLYARYKDQFDNPMASSENAEASIPTLPASELEYHVTYFDERVFQVERITAEGILYYSVKDAPITEMSFMNIVFVIK